MEYWGKRERNRKREDKYLHINIQTYMHMCIITRKIYFKHNTKVMY